MKKKWRWLMMPLLAALFISAAGAAEVGTEQVLLDGDQAAFTPVSVEPIEINGVPTLTKTYEMRPDLIRRHSKSSLLNRMDIGIAMTVWTNRYSIKPIQRRRRTR